MSQQSRPLGSSDSKGKGKPPQLPSGPKVLPSSTPIPRREQAFKKGTMFVMVICGATLWHDDVNAAMFADFMAITMALKDISDKVLVNAYSCFQIEQYFQRWNDVKWGFDHNDQPFYKYTRAQYNSETRFFTQIKPEDLYGLVEHKMKKLSSIAKAEDVVNIFFQCHGSHSGQIQLGKNLITAEEVNKLLQNFEKGVQVNLVGSHCYSGMLVDVIKAEGASNRYAAGTAGPEEQAYTAKRTPSNRFRQMRATQPIIQSLAKIKLPHIEQTPSGPLTVKDHDAFLTEALRLSFGLFKPQKYTSWLSEEKTAALELVENLIFRDQADVLYQPETIHRRRRVEWPSIDLPALNRLTRTPMHPDSEIMDQMRRLCTGAFRECGDYPAAGDGFVHQEMRKPEPDFLTLFKNLYWRGRQQSAVFDLWWTLYERDLLDLRCLEHPWNCYVSGPNLAPVMAIFEQFPGVQDLYDPSFKPFEGFTSTTLPIVWLAAMIARACTEQGGKTFETIHFTNILGPIDLERLHELAQLRRDRKFSWLCRLDEASKSSQGQTGDFFGCWLPSGLGPNLDLYPERIVGRLQRFQRTERIFKKLFDVPNYELVLEDEQDEGHDHVISYLLAQGARVNDTNTPSHAISSGHPQSISLFFDTPVQHDIADAEWDSCILAAVSCDNLSLLQQLLSPDMDVGTTLAEPLANPVDQTNRGFGQGEDAAWLLQEYMEEACKSGALEVIKHFIQTYKLTEGRFSAAFGSGLRQIAARYHSLQLVLSTP
ncbi:MAG: hypothetical protein Q9227_001124 [Pyrenula ochraceoflavens]